MTERIVPTIPFVNLHAHTVAGSVFDALGYPEDHFNFAYENGLDAMAITDHGNCNSLAYSVLHAKKMEEQGKNFKPIYGCEAYFVPSISDWRKEYTKAMEDKKQAQKVVEGETSGTTIENEEETKKSSASILNHRRHLVLLAQNQTGLNNLFKLVSDAIS